MVARTTKRRQSVLEKIQVYGLPFVTFTYPDVAITVVEYGRDIAVYSLFFSTELDYLVLGHYLIEKGT
jgi:hypothetical protein